MTGDGKRAGAPDDAVLPEQHLRAEVRRMKTVSARRRVVTALLHVGDLGGARLVVPLRELGTDADVPLAGDVLTRAFDRSGRPAEQQVWLTRGGALVGGDADWRWRAATTAARLRHGLPAGWFFVVTRDGWMELPGGRSRRWTRMRASWCPPYEDDRVDLDAPDPVEGWSVRF